MKNNKNFDELEKSCTFAADMVRYNIQQLRDGKWICTDNLSGLVCTFEPHKYEETSKFHFARIEDDRKTNAAGLKRAKKEMYDYLVQFHENKINTPVPERLRIGNKIANLRKIKGMKQTDLADIIGVTQATISLIERGKVSAGFDILQAIASNLGCEVDIVSY